MIFTLSHPSIPIPYLTNSFATGHLILLLLLPCPNSQKTTYTFSYSLLFSSYPFVSVTNTWGTLSLETQWLPQPGYQTDNLHSTFCSPNVIPHCHPLPSSRWPAWACLYSLPPFQWGIHRLSCHNPAFLPPVDPLIPKLSGSISFLHVIFWYIEILFTLDPKWPHLAVTQKHFLLRDAKSPLSPNIQKGQQKPRKTIKER